MMFGFGPFSESAFGDVGAFIPGQWSPAPIILNTWTGSTEVPNTWTPETEVPNTWSGDGGFFSVLSSNGQSYVVSREVLTSTGVAYLVSGEVLTSSGVIVDLANPWQNVSTASNTWS